MALEETKVVLTLTCLAVEGDDDPLKDDGPSAEVENVDFQKIELVSLEWL